MEVSTLVEKAEQGDAAELQSELNDSPALNEKAVAAAADGDADGAGSSEKSEVTDKQVEESNEEVKDAPVTGEDDSAKPEQEDTETVDADSKQSASSDAAAPSKREPEAEKAEQSVDTPQPKPMKRVTASSVGKSGVKGKSTPAKRTPVAKMPSSAKVSSSSKKFDVIHAKQIAKEPTIYEHDKAKKAKADNLLHSVTRATRSSAKKIVASKSKEELTTGTSVAKKIVFKASRNHVSVADRPTISSSLKRAETKKATKESAAPARKSSQPKAAPFTSTVTAGPKKIVTLAKPKAKAVGDAKPKRPLNYKPYTGPLPKYKEDPLFSPVTRAKIEEANAKPKFVHTPAKKGKENAKPVVNSTAGRTPIKKAASSSALTDKAKDDRRAKFSQDAKTKAAGARQSPRRAVKAE